MYALLKDTKEISMLGEPLRIYLYYKLRIRRDDGY